MTKKDQDPSKGNKDKGKGGGKPGGDEPDDEGDDDGGGASTECTGTDQDAPGTCQ